MPCETLPGRLDQIYNSLALSTIRTIILLIMKSNSRLIFIVDDDPDDRQIILDAFLEKRIDLVPWGFPCVRVEGGRGYTGKGSTADSCEVGVPGGVNIANRRFVVDEVLGTVSVYCTFGAGGPNGEGASDSRPQVVRCEPLACDRQKGLSRHHPRPVQFH